MKIEITIIPHKAQRYPTCGDWYFHNGALKINVSATGDWRMEALVAVHELVETLVCTRRGITQLQVDAWDGAFEELRRKGDTSEPGDAPQAPYRREHRFAEKLEKLLAKELGVDWRKYGKTLDKLK